MFCPNCGNNVKEGERFCKTCGTSIPEASNVQNSISINTNVNDNDIDLIKAYIGKNADKIMNSKWSWPSFFFGPIYLLYRKMYLIGFGVLLLNFVLYNIMTNGYSFINLIICILLAVFFSKLYLKQVDKKVANIKQNNSASTDRGTLMNLCTQKGGTAIWVIFIITPIYVITILYVIFYTAIWPSAKIEAGLSSACNGELGLSVEGDDYIINCDYFTNESGEWTCTYTDLETSEIKSKTCSLNDTNE